MQLQFRVCRSVQFTLDILATSATGLRPIPPLVARHLQFPFRQATSGVCVGFLQAALGEKRTSRTIDIIAVLAAATLAARFMKDMMRS